MPATNLDTETIITRLSQHTDGKIVKDRWGRIGVPADLAEKLVGFLERNDQVTRRQIQGFIRQTVHEAGYAGGQKWKFTADVLPEGSKHNESILVHPDEEENWEGDEVSWSRVLNLAKPGDTFIVRVLTRGAYSSDWEECDEVEVTVPTTVADLAK